MKIRYLIIALLFSIFSIGAKAQENKTKSRGYFDLFVADNIITQNKELSELRSFSIGYWFLPEFKVSIEHFSNVDFGTAYKTENINEMAVSLMLSVGYKPKGNFGFVFGLGPGIAWTPPAINPVKYHFIGDFNIQGRYYYNQKGFIGLNVKAIAGGNNGSTCSFFGVTWGYLL